MPVTGKLTDIRVAASTQRFFCLPGALAAKALDEDDLLGFRDGKLRQARRQLVGGDIEGARDVASRVLIAGPDVQDERRRARLNSIGELSRHDRSAR